jgi:hypothetical protein
MMAVTYTDAQRASMRKLYREYGNAALAGARAGRA